MSHGLTKKDTMFSVREVPWHGLGKVLTKRPKNIDEALKLANLNWEVVKAPMYVGVKKSQRAKEQMLPVEDYFLTVRTDTMEPLAPVHERFQPIQNRDAFLFLENILGEVIIETGGSVYGGKRVWLMCCLPDFVEIAGDNVKQYIGVYSGHDAKQALTTAATPVRWVCANTISYGLNVATGKYTVRHIGGHDNLSLRIHEAREALGISINYYKQFKKVGDKLGTKKLSDGKFEKVLTDLYPIEQGMGDRAAKNRTEARQTIMALFKGTLDKQQAKTVGNAPGTAWCATNAVAEFQDHYVKTSSMDTRFLRVTEDPGQVKQRAFRMIAESVGVSV
jgi:phage/plasmid-like protein (TIGR03299 family)